MNLPGLMLLFLYGWLWCYCPWVSPKKDCVLSAPYPNSMYRSVASQNQLSIHIKLLHFVNMYSAICIWLYPTQHPIDCYICLREKGPYHVWHFTKMHYYEIYNEHCVNSVCCMFVYFLLERIYIIIDVLMLMKYNVLTLAIPRLKFTSRTDSL